MSSQDTIKLFENFKNFKKKGYFVAVNLMQITKLIMIKLLKRQN